MSTDITTGVGKLAITEENDNGKEETFDINWDAAVTDSWVDDNFDIDASVREADTWVSDNDSDEGIHDDIEKLQNKIPPRGRRKSEHRDINARVKHQAKNAARSTDLADIMRGIQAKLGNNTRESETKRETSNPLKETITTSSKTLKTQIRRHNNYSQTNSSPPSSASNSGFRYLPPSKPRGKSNDSKQALPSIWSEENQTLPAKVNYAATREHYAAKKTLWRQQQMEHEEQKGKQKDTKPTARKATPAVSPAHSHFAYSDDDEPTPATAPATAPAPPKAEPLPSMWA